MTLCADCFSRFTLSAAVCTPQLVHMLVTKCAPIAKACLGKVGVGTKLGPPWQFGQPMTEQAMEQQKFSGTE